MKYDITISNPPFNIPWQPPELAGMMPEYILGVPPKNNANFAFVLNGFYKADEKSLFILPNSVLFTKFKDEKAIISNLVKSNFLESVIILPPKMFTNTDIPTCILQLNKHKKTALVEMVDLTNHATTETREQNGQFGGASHTNRVYNKNFNILSDEIITKTLESIKELKNINGFCKAISIIDIEKHSFDLRPGLYIDNEIKEAETRSYQDIISDYNRVIVEKNSLKLVVNETLAKRLGLYDIAKDANSAPDLSRSFSIVGEKAVKADYITLTKNKLELKFENHSMEGVSSILMIILQMWKQHIYFLNIEENRYLSELRDKMLPDLMSGKIKI